MAVGANQMLSTTQVQSITDAVGQSWVVLDPYLGEGTGTLTGGYWADVGLGRVVGKSGTSYGVADKYKHADVDAGAQSFADSLLSRNFWSYACSSLVSGMDSNVSKYSSYVSTTITNLDTFATYHNSQNAFSMLFCHAFARMYYYYRAQGAMLSPGNVLSTSIVLCSGTVTGTAAVTFTDGSTINTVNTLTATVQGYAQDNMEILITSGTFTGTVTATAITQAAATAYWTVPLTGYTSAGTAVGLTPGTAGNRTGNVTGLNYTGNGTAASFNIRSVGRDLTL